MKVKDLFPNPQNPRKITDEKLKMLKASLENFGDLSGIVYNRRSNQLVGGHQRVKTFDGEAVIQITRELKTPNRQGTVKEGFVTIDGETHKYREVDFDELTEKAANLAANTHGGSWDDKQRADWLLELDSENYPTEITGTTKEEFEDIVAPWRTMPEGLTDADSVPELRADTAVKSGDIYSLGIHRLMCGDSTDRQMVERLMNGEKADMVFTDPPYGLGGYGGRNNMELKGDDQDPTPFYQCIPNARERYVWGYFWTFPMLNFKPKDAIIWKKNNFGLGRGYRGQYEVCFYEGEFNESDSDVWEQAKDTEYKHPTQKPVGLAVRAINNSKPKNVLDLFLGSGSTLIACEKTNRKCYGMEIDPQYCQVIIDRWEKYTGRKAEKIGTAEIPDFNSTIVKHAQT